MRRGLNTWSGLNSPLVSRCSIPRVCLATRWEGIQSPKVLTKSITTNKSKFQLDCHRYACSGSYNGIQWLNSSLPQVKSRPFGGMELTILGTSSAVPISTRGLSSYHVRMEHASFLFDCGEGAQLQLRRSQLANFKGIEAMFITHLHGMCPCPYLAYQHHTMAAIAWKVP